MSIFHYELEIAKLILAGCNVAFDSERAHFDDRLLQKYIIQLQPKAYDVVVLGSSTTMQINAKFFPRKSFFNYSLRRGVLEDYFALLQLLREKRHLPKHLIIGVDPWLFDPKHWKIYYLPLQRALKILTKDWNLRLPINISIKNRFAYQHEIQFKRIQRMIDIVSHRPPFAPTDKDASEQYIRRCDGSTSYHASFRNRDEATIADVIRKSVRFPNYTCDSKYMEAFQKFLKKIREYQIQISLYLPPYHPEVYRLINGNEKGVPVLGYQAFMSNMVNIETTLTDFALRNNIAIVASFNSQKVNSQTSQFLDWMHSRECLLAKCFREYCSSSPTTSDLQSD